MAAIRFPLVVCLASMTLLTALPARTARAPGQAAAEPPAAQQQPAAPAARSDVARRMHERFARIGAIELAVIRGDLEDVAEPARWLADNVSDEGFPSQAQAPVSKLKSSAARAAAATDLASAAAAAADLVASCGSCHVASHAEVKLTTVPKPPNGKTRAAQMRQHNWAVELLSLALVEPSTALWRQGAESLQQIELTPAGSAADSPQAGEIRELASKVQQLATKAVNVTDPTQRSEIYGQVIATCGTCHGLNGVVLGPGIPVN